jgi:hypothetical protein
MRDLIHGAILALAALPSLAANVLPPRIDRTPAAMRIAAKPPLRAEAATLVLSTMGATKNDLAELRAANAASDGPMHLGVVREVARLSIDSVTIEETPWRWHGAVSVTGANRIRLRLEELPALPPNTRMWIYGTSGEAILIDPTLAHDGKLWTPSVAGELATLEIEAPAPVRFSITAVADVREPREVIAAGTECVTDVSCHADAVDPSISRGIAFYEFVAGTHLLGCTGGLLDNVNGDGAPFFLTANHCVRNQEQASTVETVWDYRTATCNGPAPSRNDLPRHTGATLLVTSSVSDVTLLRLASIPSGRTFLGWDARPLAVGTALFHLSHPNASPQRYSSSVVDAEITECAASPRSAFLYSRPITGATDIGSSGAPVLYGNGIVAGQLKSACGPEPDNACNRANAEVDGAFAASWPLLAPFLAPEPEPCTTCTPDAATACMLGSRFKVTVAWTDPTFGGGPGKPIRYAENRAQVHPIYGPIIESTFFSFYDFFPGSVETMVKMTKGVGINDHYWVFVTGFSGAAYMVSVQDTRTCATWQKSMPRDAVTAIRDYEAFPLP